MQSLRMLRASIWKSTHISGTSDILMETDKGGMVLQPDPGIYTDVYEIDFSSREGGMHTRYHTQTWKWVMAS